MKSMTGYGRSAVSQNDIEIEIEIKSVNSRYLDLKIYLPRDLGFHEIAIRRYVATYLSRGAVEIRINFTDRRPPSLVLNKGNLLKYHDLASAAVSELALQDRVSIEFLLNEPGVIENQKNLAEDPILAELLDKALTLALDKAAASMEQEGLQTKAVLAESMHKLIAAVRDVSTHVEPFKADLYQNMLNRIKDLIGNYHLENLEQRLVQELAIYVDKYDIGEELSRLESHYQTFMSTLEKDGEIGKTLNFIIQEMQREANTLGSKFSTSKSFPLVLVIKEEVEKCREIIQNVA
ncbi:MAG: YicC family protein [Candidatus Cloacimonetes bacterium]|nr:YicC family protein [Candidatus Cloacimonadota bacterium]